MCVCGKRAWGLVAVLVVIAGCGVGTGAATAASSSPFTWSSPEMIDSGGTTTPPQLSGVSCPSVSLCVAVDSYGNVVSSTEPANLGSWRVSRAYVNSNDYSNLDAVSCASVGFCVTSGGGTFRSSTDPAGGAGSWSAHNTPREDVPRSLSCPSRQLCVGITNGGEVWSSTEPSGNRLSWNAVNMEEEGKEGRALHGVSCPTISFCVAVGEAGNVFSTAEPTGDKEAWHLAAVDPGRAILAISCASESLCVAVDEAGDVLSSTEPVGGASTWRLATVEQGVAIHAVSCTRGSLCVAVNASGDVLTSTDPTGGVGAWDLTRVDSHSLQGVSCASASLCVATDADGDVLAATDPTGPASAWTVTQVDTSISPPLAAVSCASASLCVVSGYGSVLTSGQPTDDTGAWTVESSSTEPSFGLSCPLTSLCVGAGGDWVNASTEPRGGALTWVAEMAWIYPISLWNPEAEYFGLSGTVSCVSALLCVADGTTENDFSSLVISTDPTGGEAQWHIVGNGLHKAEEAGNKVPPPYLGDPILGVSCASVSLCLAVDAAGNVLSSSDPTSSESTWAVAPVETNVLDGVSCPSEGLCVAVDEAGDVVTSTDPAGGTGAWTVSSVDAPHQLTAVSCVTGSSLCVVTDDEGNVLVSSDPTGGARAWSIADIDSDAGASHALTAISCPTVELCVAIDNAGYAVVGIAPAPEGGGAGGGGAPSGSSGTGSSASKAGEQPSTHGGGHVPTSAFRVVRVRVKRNGTIVLTVEVSGPGVVGVIARMSIKHGHKHRTVIYGRHRRTARSASVVTLTIKPGRAAANMLRHTRGDHVTLGIAFAADGSDVTRTAKRVVTVRRRS